MASPSSSSSSLNMNSSNRFWRPAAQRNIRNCWSRIIGARSNWTSASSNSMALANSVVNSHLQIIYLPSMDLGALKNMPGIVDGAQSKLLEKQEQDMCKLLSAYKELVNAVFQMFNASISMRTYLKGSASSPIMEFCNSPGTTSDLGDGGGIPIFSSLSMQTFEKMGEEVVDMFKSELKVKRLLIKEFQSIVSPDEKVWDWNEEVYMGENERIASLITTQFEKNSLGLLKTSENRDILQVYLTAWLAEVNINNSRIEEIKALVEDEIQASLV